CMQALQSPFTI
nr:immunoglobulin light chain junction region [Macaca mulatta]